LYEAVAAFGRRDGCGTPLALGPGMSHRSVEVIIGKLATDEGFRRRFVTDATATLEELRQGGCELTPVEVAALVALDLEVLDRLAAAIDHRLQKIDFGTS
jgi:hypothetical protein